jgi:uncharacterized protein YndB with AHSA1/START domain
MAMTHSIESPHGAREIVLIREFKVPRELLFRLWTEPEHIMRWWGPHNASAPSASVDLRQDGTWRHCILAPDGKEYWSQGRYLEVTPPERLVFTFAWEDSAGRPSHQMQVIVELQEKGGGTRLVFRKSELPDDREFQLQTEGWTEALERAEIYASVLITQGSDT